MYITIICKVYLLEKPAYKLHFRRRNIMKINNVDVDDLDQLDLDKKDVKKWEDVE